MDKIITLLTSLFNLTKVASVSLPGLLSAAALTILMWPPPPTDFILKATLRPDRIEIGQKACDITMDKLRGVTGLSGAEQIKVDNQYQLDVQKLNLAACVEYETSLKGREKTDNDQLALDLPVREKERTAVQDSYIAYEKANHPLAATYHAKLGTVEAQINGIRTRIKNNEQSIRERDRRLSELTRYSALLGERLADPGRLRPRKEFDGYLAELTNHVVALVLLSLAMGLVITAVDWAVFGSLFELLFRGF